MNQFPEKEEGEPDAFRELPEILGGAEKRSQPPQNHITQGEAEEQVGSIGLTGHGFPQ
jgi:hypothetical protein